MFCVPDITYDTDAELRLDLYLPDNLTADACVIYAHGGNFHTGSRKASEATHFAKAFTDRNLALASVSYRLNTNMDAFGTEDQMLIRMWLALGAALGLSVKPKYYGPAFIAACQDISNAMKYLRREGAELGITSQNVGILGTSAGGIAALSLAHPPQQWKARWALPDAVVTLASAIVYPWNVTSDAPPCLALHGPRDPIIDAKTASLGFLRGEQLGAPVTLFSTGIPGHHSQIDVALDGRAPDGQRYIEKIVKHFESLRSVRKPAQLTAQP